MRANRQAHELSFLRAAQRVVEAQEAIFRREDAPSTAEAESTLAQIESLKKVYQTEMSIPTWPVNMETWIKFFSAQLALWSSIPLTIFEIWNKVQPLVSKIFDTAR